MNYDMLFSGNNIIWGLNSWNNENPPLINTPITPDHYTNNNLTLLSSGIPGVDGLQIQFQYDKVIGGTIGYNRIITKPVAKLAEPIEKPVFGCNMWVVKTNDAKNNYSLIQWNDDEDRNVWKIDTVEITNTNIYIAPLSMYTDNYSYNIKFGINQSIIGGTFNGKQIIEGGGNMIFQNLYKNNQKPYIGNTETFTYTLEGYKDGRNINKYFIKYTASSIQIQNVTNKEGYQNIDPDWNGNILKFQLTDRGKPYRSGYIVFGNDMGPDKIFFASIIENGRTEYTYRDIRPSVSFLSSGFKGETLPPSNIIPTNLPTPPVPPSSIKSWYLFDQYNNQYVFTLNKENTYNMVVGGIKLKSIPITIDNDTVFYSAYNNFSGSVTFGPNEQIISGNIEGPGTPNGYVEFTNTPCDPIIY